MNFDLLFNNFDLLLSSPTQIRQLNLAILQLAVRGKLGTQNTMDQPATELVKRIKAEKERLIRLGRIKREKQLALISFNEIPFELPRGWMWVRLGDITLITLGQSPPSDTYNTVKEGLPFYQGKADFGKIYPTPTKWCSTPEKVAEKGDVLISIRAPVGPTNICNEKSCIGRGLAAIRVIEGVSNFYILYALRAFEKAISGGGYGTTFTAITGDDLNNLLIPLPPLNEQQRIVVKIEDLQIRTQEIEVQLREKEQEILELNDAGLSQLLDAKNTDEFQERWRFISKNFDLLYSHERNINQLKEAILQLAIQGKLVPQDPIDESATELLKRIKAEKLRLMREKKIKKDESLSPISEDESFYGLPQGWTWVRFGDVVINRDGERIPLAKEERQKRQGEYDYYGASGVIDKIDDYLFDKPLLLIGEDGANLINRSTPIAFIAYGKYWVNNHAHVVDSLDFIILRYLEIYINAIDLRPYITGTAQPKMNQAKLNSIPIALPPLNTQKRIVAKVDELMKLCDELEEQSRQLKEESERLMQAVLREAFEGKYSEESDQEVSAA